MNRRNHSFVMESKLHDVKGRVDYISSLKRQENLYAVFSNVEDSYWELLAEQNQRDFTKSGTEGTCIEARELIIMLPPSLIEYDHEILLKYITSKFAPIIPVILFFISLSVMLGFSSLNKLITPSL